MTTGGFEVKYENDSPHMKKIIFWWAICFVAGFTVVNASCG